MFNMAGEKQDSPESGEEVLDSCSLTQSQNCVGGSTYLHNLSHKIGLEGQKTPLPS